MLAAAITLIGHEQAFRAAVGFQRDDAELLLEGRQQLAELNDGEVADFVENAFDRHWGTSFT